MYLGSWKIDDYLTFACNTHTPSTGVATDADAVPTYRIYEDETGTPIVTGSTALLDTGNTTGFYSEQVQLTSGAGFEKGKTYTIYVTATVGGVSGTMSHTFQMEAEVDANIVSDKTGFSLAADQSAVTVGTVTLVTTTTTNTDMRGTDSAALASAYTAGRAAYLDELAAANLPTDIANIPTVTEFNARTIPSADYVVVGDTIAGVTLVTTCTTNTDMRGTNNAALAATALTDVTWTDAKAAFIDHAISTVDTNVDTLLTRITAARAGYLDNLSAGAVALASVSTETRLAELDAANIPSDIDDILADTGTDGVLLAAGATSAQLTDDVWDEILTGVTHNVGDSAGKRLREMFDAGLYEEETAQAGTVNTITLATTASAIDDFYNYSTLTIIDGTGAGQMRTFKDYNGTTKVATACTDWSVTPDATSKYVITGHACAGVFAMQTGVYDLINVECDTALTDYGANTTVPDVAGTAAGLHTTTDALINGLDDITVAEIIAGIADGTYDLQEMMRLIFAASCAKVSGGGTTTLTFRDGPDSKNRITTTVDVNGNRTATTLDGT